jgi:hypothetical protein
MFPTLPQAVLLTTAIKKTRSFCRLSANHQRFDSQQLNGGIPCVRSQPSKLEVV